MDTKEVKMNIMSPFCEAIMDTTKNLNELRGKFDHALILCSDGNTMACRIAGAVPDIALMLRMKMQEDPVFAEAVGMAVFYYMRNMAYRTTPIDERMAPIEKPKE